MKRLDISRTGWSRTCHCIAVIATFVIAAPSFSTAADAQTRTAPDTATAYGARLNAKGEPANLNPNRINSRVSSRLETRLSLRIERYRPNSTNDPATAFAARLTDNVRVGTDTTLSPLSKSTSLPTSQTFKVTSQTSREPSVDGEWPR